MTAYLFLWNPKIDPASFEDYEELAEYTSLERPYNTRWICPSKRPRPGDLAYVKRTGPRNNGLFARGTVVGKPNRDNRDGIQCVKLSLNSLLPLGQEVGAQVLKRPPLSATFWNTQGSGMLIRPESEQELDRLWQRAISESLAGEETIVPGGFSEGAVRRIRVNAYERNEQARQICIDHHGLQCAACGMSFADRYGPLARGFVHVHHLRQLSTVGPDYQVDPVDDLRPVCPNCHAVIHLRVPPYSIDEVRGMLSQTNVGS